MGNQPGEPGALALMAEVLCQSASDEQIAAAMTRCCRECRYPVRLSDFLQRIPGQEIPAPEAEARKAWDVVVTFVSKWVQSDVEGNYVISRGVRSQDPPQLSDRILDVVRRTGGWATYKRMTDEDFPFVQKRFFEEFCSWAAVERVDVGHILAGAVPEAKRLTAMPVSAEVKPVPVRTFQAKPVPQPLPDDRLRARREMLTQQAQSLRQAHHSEGSDTQPLEADSQRRSQAQARG